MSRPRGRGQRWRNVVTKRICGLEVDDKVKLCRPPHPEIARLGTFDNPARVNAGLTISVGNIGS